MDDNQLDRAIDRVAREITAHEPESAAGFRARVMARLDEPKPIWRSPWVLSPIAVAAIVLIVIFVQRDGGKATPTPSETVAPQQTSAARQAPSRSAEAERSTADAARSAKASRSSSSSLEREALAEQPSEVAALAPPPLAVESIAVTEIAPAASIQVPQMEIIEPITVAPIGEPQGERP